MAAGVRPRAAGASTPSRLASYTGDPVTREIETFDKPTLVALIVAR